MSAEKPLRNGTASASDDEARRNEQTTENQTRNSNAPDAAGPSQQTPPNKTKQSRKGPRKRAVPGIVSDSLLAEMVLDYNQGMMFATSTSTGLADCLQSRRSVRGISVTEVLVPSYELTAFVNAGALQLPSRAERGVSAAELTDEIKGFIERWNEIPQGWLMPIANYVLMTWVFDRFGAVPYLRFLGEYGTGKNRMAQSVAALCYRSLAASGNISGAALFRSIDLIRGALLVDEADFKNSAESSELIKVLNNGYTPGLPVIRCDTFDRNKPRPYWVYGPKIINTRHRFQDCALESRCITFQTRKQTVDRRIPLQLTREFYDQARNLRNKLLGWRFDSFFSIQPDDSMLRHLDPRSAQVGASLMAVATDKGAMAGFLTSYAQTAEEDAPREIVRQILDDLDVKGQLVGTRVSEVATEVNAQLMGSELDAGESNTITPKEVGSLIRSLGYKTKRRNVGYVIEEKP